MKKALVVLAIAALASTAMAAETVTIFMTSSADPYGLTNPAKAMDPTGLIYSGTQYDGYDLGTWGTDPANGLAEYGVTPIGTDLAPATPTIDPAAGEFAYIWLRMDDVKKNAKVRGIDIGISGDVTDVAYYVVDDTAGDPGVKRWDGVYTPPTEPEFKMNPQILAAVTSNGLINAAATPFDQQNLQLFYGNEVSGGVPPTTTADSVYLLGAVEFGLGNYGADIYLGDLGLDIIQTVGDVEIVLGSANVIPEPASMLLLGLAGFFLRRR